MKIDYVPNGSDYAAVHFRPGNLTSIVCGDPVYTTNFCGDDLVVVHPRGYPPTPQGSASWQPASPETAEAARKLVVLARLKGIGDSNHVFHFVETKAGLELKQTFPCIR